MITEDKLKDIILTMIENNMLDSTRSLTKNMFWRELIYILNQPTWYVQ